MRKEIARTKQRYLFLLDMVHAAEMFDEYGHSKVELETGTSRFEMLHANLHVASMILR